MCTLGEEDRGKGTGGRAALVQVVLSFCTLVGCCTGSVLGRWFLGGEKSPDSFHSVMCGQCMAYKPWSALCMQGKRVGCQSSLCGVAAGRGWGIMMVLLVLSAQLPNVVCKGLWGGSGTWAAANA